MGGDARIARVVTVEQHRARVAVDRPLDHDLRQQPIQLSQTARIRGLQARIGPHGLALSVGRHLQLPHVRPLQVVSRPPERLTLRQQQVQQRRATGRVDVATAQLHITEGARRQPLGQRTCRPIRNTHKHTHNARWSVATVVPTQMHRQRKHCVRPLQRTRPWDTLNVGDSRPSLCPRHRPIEPAGDGVCCQPSLRAELRRRDARLVFGDGR